VKKELLILFIIGFSLLIFAQVPEWQWAVQAGGNSSDEGYAIGIDEEGSSYIAGNFRSTASFGSNTLTSNGGSDIFVAKIDLNGNWLWATNVGDSSLDAGSGIIVDADGNCYVTGWFIGTANFGSYCLISNGDMDIFIAKIDTDGNWLWATQAGGNGTDEGYAVTIDGEGCSYVTGNFQNTAIFGSYALNCSGPRDVFIAKLDTTGNWLWAIQSGGNDWAIGCGITIDSAGNIYAIGQFLSTATFGSYSLISSGDWDIFVAKIDTNGDWLWVTSAGGDNWDTVNGITIDCFGDSFVTGEFRSTATFGSNSLTSYGGCDLYVAKIDTNGNWLWAKTGYGSIARGYAITCYDDINIYLTGSFSGTVHFGSYTLTNELGPSDIFVAKIDTDGNWQWGIQVGGYYYDRGYGITTDSIGNIYLTGSFEVFITFGSHSLSGCTYNYTDIFVAKLGNDTSANIDIIPTKMKLSNHPNPFNPSTTIEFSVQNDSEVELVVYNITGQKINTLVHNEFIQGDQSVVWNGEDEKGNTVSSGVYLYILNVNGKTEAMKRCILLK
jgi:hypothetical protein